MTAHKKLLPFIPSYEGHKTLTILAWLAAIALWPITVAFVLSRWAAHVNKPRLRYAIFGFIALFTLFNGVVWAAICSASISGAQKPISNPKTSDSAETPIITSPTITERETTTAPEVRQAAPTTSESLAPSLPPASPTTSARVAPASPTCDSSLWNHIYHAYRLRPIQQCVTITGTVDHLIHEADGDIHVRLHLDAAYSAMVNNKNISEQHGDLVLEAVCEESPTQADAVSACANYRSSVVIPAVGTHVAVTGSYVFDADHGWNEIHPITSIAPIP